MGELVTVMRVRAYGATLPGQSVEIRPRLHEFLQELVKVVDALDVLSR